MNTTPSTPAVPSEKLANLLTALDPAQPAAAAVGASGDAGKLLELLSRPPRGRHRFEYARKGEMLGFLRECFASWRTFDTAGAAKFEAMTLEQAKAPRATMNIASLGRAWWATGDERYGRAFEKFYLAAPTGEMFNWGSFNGSQGVKEIDAYFLLLDCPGFSRAGRIAFLDHLYAITCDAWDTHTSTWPQLSLGTEGHNWYLHGMHSLPFFGLLFPEFARSAFFVKTGWSVVEEHVRGHYKDDGGARETTLGYQCGNMRCLWDFYLIAHRNGWPVSSGFVEKLVNATMFLLRLAAPDGMMPAYGDTFRPDSKLAALASIAAALSGDGECKWYAERLRTVDAGIPEGETPGRITESAFWAVGLEGAQAYEQTREKNPNHTSVLMGPTGYAALRDADGRDASYMSIAAADRGPIVTSHGHNEIFSVDVSAMGVRFLGESGPAPYGDSVGRDYDQSTQAHNCLTVDDREQAPLIGEWRWGRVVTPAVRRWISEPTHDFFHGVHEGYYTYRSGQETIHARKVFFAKAGAGLARSYWVVMDWLSSREEHDYSVYWHGCVPGAVKGKAIELGDAGATRLAVIPPAGDAMTPRQVTGAGLSAYLTEKKLDAARHPCFVYSHHAQSDCLIWVLVPLAPGEALPTVERVPVKVNGREETHDGASAVRVKFANCTDTLCVSHKDFDAELAFGKWKDWGHLSLHRESADGRALATVNHTMADGICGR